MKKTRKAARGGKAIKLSHEVIGVLKKKQKKNESFDSVIRRVLGMPNRSGEPQELKVLYALTEPGLVFESLQAARGESMVQAAMKKKRKAAKPIKLREYV